MDHQCRRKFNSSTSSDRISSSCRPRTHQNLRFQSTNTMITQQSESLPPPINVKSNEYPNQIKFISRANDKSINEIKIFPMKLKHHKIILNEFVNSITNMNIELNKFSKKTQPEGFHLINRTKEFDPSLQTGKVRKCNKQMHMQSQKLT